jgi:integrase
MPREIVLRPPGKLTAPWLNEIRIEDGALYRGRELVAEDVRRVTVKDTNVVGLELRISATGARSWAVSRRVKGIQRRFTIEDSAGLTLAQAREKALALRADTSRGRDPTDERRQERKAARLAKLGVGKAWTIETLLAEYGEKVAVPARQRSWEERRGHVLREFRDLAGLPIGDLDDALIWRVLDAATARGAKVGGWHALRYLRSVLAWALSRKLIERDPTADLPMKDIRRQMKERTRERVLAPDELGRLWRAFEGEPGNLYSAVLRVAALTAQRIGEVAGMRWGDVDLARAEWRQPTNKSDRPHLVPLSPPAVAILDAQPRRRGVPYVFTTAAGGRLDRRTSNVYRATARFSATSGVTGWAPHDLRRTAASILGEAKVPPVVIEQLLNHAEGAGKGSAVAGIYNRASYSIEKRQAVELLADKIATFARADGAEVIEFSRGTG